MTTARVPRSALNIKATCGCKPLRQPARQSQQRAYLGGLSAVSHSTALGRVVNNHIVTPHFQPQTQAPALLEVPESLDTVHLEEPESLATAQ